MIVMRPFNITWINHNVYKLCLSLLTKRLNQIPLLEVVAIFMTFIFSPNVIKLFKRLDKFSKCKSIYPLTPEFLNVYILSTTVALPPFTQLA